MIYIQELDADVASKSVYFLSIIQNFEKHVLEIKDSWSNDEQITCSVSAFAWTSHTILINKDEAGICVAHLT